MKTWVGAVACFATVAAATGCGRTDKNSDQDATPVVQANADSPPGSGLAGTPSPAEEEPAAEPAAPAHDSEPVVAPPANGEAAQPATPDAIQVIVDRCTSERAADCTVAEQQARAAEADRAAALANKDWPGYMRASLELNYRVELLLLIARNQDAVEIVNALDTKYAALRSQLEDDISSGIGATPVTPGEQPPPLPYVYQESETAAVAAVMRDFGPLYIKESPLDEVGRRTSEELSVERPWSGFWFPARGSELFDGPESPLAKLDAAVAASGRTSDASEIERRRSAGASDTWEGLCNAWALAAISSPEPASDVTVGGVTFTPFDQKALLVKIHERAPTKMYGMRYNGDAASDGTIQDVRPEAFHRLATVMLGERKKPFVIDDDPGPEVWSKPLYRLRWSVEKDGEFANAFKVKAFPWLVRHRSSVDPRPTDNGDRAAPVYEYRLWVDPTDVRDGMQKVIAGEWLGVARNSHPDSITLPAGGSNDKASINAGVNNAMDVIRQVVTVD